MSYFLQLNFLHLLNDDILVYCFITPTRYNEETVLQCICFTHFFSFKIVSTGMLISEFIINNNPLTEATTLQHCALSWVESTRSSTDRPVQSLILSGHIFLGLPFYCVPCNNPLETLLCSEYIGIVAFSSFYPEVGHISIGFVTHLPLGYGSHI